MQRFAWIKKREPFGVSLFFSLRFHVVGISFGNPSAPKLVRFGWFVLELGEADRLTWAFVCTARGGDRRVGTATLIWGRSVISESVGSSAGLLLVGSGKKSGCFSRTFTATSPLLSCVETGDLGWLIRNQSNMTCLVTPGALGSMMFGVLESIIVRAYKPVKCKGYSFGRGAKMTSAWLGSIYQVTNRNKTNAKYRATLRSTHGREEWKLNGLADWEIGWFARWKVV